MSSVEMKATGPEGFSKAAMALHPSDCISALWRPLYSGKYEKKTQGRMVLWPPFHQGGWERGRTGMGQSQQHPNEFWVKGKHATGAQ